MKESSDKAMEINIDYSDEVKEIIATRIPMKNRCVCVTCKQRLTLKKWCKTHL